MPSVSSLSHSPAQSIVLDDSSFHPEDFTLVQGLLSASWDRLPQYPSALSQVLCPWSQSQLFNLRISSDVNTY